MLYMVALHILASIWFIAGLLGRSLAYAHARRASDLTSITALLHLSDRFERMMVIPGSQAVLVFGLLAAFWQGRPLLGGAYANWLPISLLLLVSLIPVVIAVLIPRRKRRLQALNAALALGTITPELRAALADAVVIRARAIDLSVVAIVLVLMIFKPF